MNEKVPSIVLALSEKVGMKPLAWAVKPDEIVIVFEHGAKMKFEREDVPGAEPAKIIPEAPTQKTITPEIQKLPVRRSTGRPKK